MPKRVLIISDTHLAGSHSRARHPECLRPLWRSADCLIINGDAAEVHHPFRRAEAARQILFLQSLCERDGVELTLLSGNHDAFISDNRYLSLADGQIFITHGDVFHPAIAPWSRSAQQLEREMAEALASLPPDDRDQLHARLAAAQHAAHTEWLGPRPDEGRFWSLCLDLLSPPTRLFKLLHYWKNIPRLANRFVQEHAPQSRFVVFGHTHRQGVWRFGERTVINTGGFSFPAHPRAVMVTPTELSIWSIQLHQGHFRLAGKPMHAFALQPAELNLQSVAEAGPIGVAGSDDSVSASAA